MYILRGYQRKAVAAAIECFRSKKNGILVLPTGSGKSVIIAKIIEVLGGKTLLLQPTKEILEQNLEKLRQVGCKGLGVYSASMGQKHVGTITLATIGSVVKKGFLFSDFDRIIIDECHGVNSKDGMYKNLIELLKLPVLGLTATPYRMRTYRHFKTGDPIAESWFITRTRPNIFKSIVHITQVKELFDAAYLCRTEYDCDNDYNSSKITKTSTGMGYNPESLKRYNRSMSIVQKTVDAVMNTDRKNYLIFTELTSDSKEVIRLLALQGITCMEVSAETKPKDRERIIRDFKSGRLNHVVNVGTMTTGFDYPELECIVLAAPGQSVTLYGQKVGRGARIADGKEYCLLIDLCDNVKKFGKIETFEIVDCNEGQKGKRQKFRLKSDVGYLTGVDMVSGNDLEDPKVEEYPVELDADGDEIVPFGQHKGKKLCKASNEYLEYFCTAKFPNGKVKAFCKKELKRRKNALL